MIAIADSAAANSVSPHDDLPCLPLVCANVPPVWINVLRQAGVPWTRLDPAQKQGRFLICDRRQGPTPRPLAGQIVIDMARLADAPDEPIELLLDEQTARRAWRIDEWELIETVARVDKRQVRRRWLNALRREIQSHGGTWLTLSPVPWPYRTVFNLRADHDTCIPADYEAFLDLIVGHESSVSHFICAGGFIDQWELLERLQGHDVGSHGYRHHTYQDPRANRRNIARGIKALQRTGIEPSGFVAPHGRYPPGMTAILKELRISHSGEFALAYDDWPYYLHDSRALQIPVHPICLGLAFEALAPTRSQREGAETNSKHRAADMIAEHFSRWAWQQYVAAEPIMIYGHPDERLGRYPQVLRRLFRSLADLPQLWRANQTEIARWWAIRDRITLKMKQTSGRLELTARELPESHRVAVDVWRGEQVARVPLDSLTTYIALDELSYERRLEPARVDSVELDDRLTLKDRARRWLDWEYATPLDEIDASSWRGWLKRRLRHHFETARKA